MSKVSVIIPLYNASLWLEQAVRSVQAQSYCDWEAVIVDDCSTDGSYEIAKKLAHREPRIKLLRLEKNSGVAVARNLAIKEASGRFIAFLDSDDIWLPLKLEKQIDFMLKNKVVFSYTAYRKINMQGRPFQVVDIPGRVNYSQILKTCVIGCLTAIYDAERLGKIYMPLGTAREDFATWLSILRTVEFAYGVPEVLASYRVYPGQGSHKKLKMAAETWGVYRKVERLSYLRSVYYFINYAFRGVMRAKLPYVAKVFRAL